MKLDRGNIFSGYFVVNPAEPTRLYGARWLNAFPCGTFINSKGVLKGMTFIILWDNDLPDDPSGRFQERLDFDVAMADSLKTDTVVGNMIKRIAVSATDLAKLDSQQQAIVAKYPNGFPYNRDIVDRDLIRLLPEWLGRRFDLCIRDRPNIWQPTVVDGVEIPNIWKCSEEKG